MGRQGKGRDERGARRGPAGAALPRRDWLVAGVAAVGVAIAGYLALTKLAGGDAVFCGAGGGCGIVQASRYAVFLGVPTAAWGAALYAVVGGLAAAGFTRGRWLLAFLVSTVGVAFSAYLSSLAVFVVGAVCGYCVASAAVAAALFGLILGRRPVPVGRRSLLRPARLAALGGLAAITAIGVGIGVFWLQGPGGPVAYAEALARHLTRSGAVMYGAFW